MEFDKPELFETWIFKKSSPGGWHFTTEKIDVIKFKKDFVLEMISIEKGLLRSLKFEVNKDQEIILEGNESFGTIQEVNQNELIIQNKVDENIHESHYSPLPISQLEISDSEIIQLIKSNRWISVTETPKGNMDWTLRKIQKECEFDFQLELKTHKKKIVLPTEVIMPAELKRVEDCLFLSCQVPNIFGDAPTMYMGRSNYFIQQLSENEIHIEMGDKKIRVQIFKKEKS